MDDRRISVDSPAVGRDALSMGVLVGLAAVIAMAAGLAELPLLLAKRFVLNHFIFVGPHVVWMAPVSYAMLFIPLAILLYAPARRWSALFSIPRLGFGFAFLGAWSALLVIRLDLHWIARVILAAGLAAQAARWLGNDPARVGRVVRRWTVRLAAIVLLLAAIVTGTLLGTERRALARLPAPGSSAPHIFLLILDTVRSASMSVYGYDGPTTPSLKRWVADRGVAFEWAIATSAWSLPSHASLLTGRYPCETGTDWIKPLDRTFPTLAEVLADHGYQTGGFIANTRYATREAGIARGFARFDDFRIASANEILRHSSLGSAVAKFGEHRLNIPELNGLKRADRINRDLLRWLSRTESERPVFVMLNYMDAHQPFIPPTPFDTLFGAPPWRSVMERAVGRVRRYLGVRVELPRAFVDGEGWADRQRQYYHGEIAYLDHEIGRLFEELDRRGFLGNAIVIITSDHGEDLAEQGDFGHGNHLYLQSALRVPLLVAWPGRVPEGIRVTEPVSVRNIPVGVMDLLGASPANFPGTPIARYWEPNPAAGRDAIVLAEMTPTALWWTGEVHKLKTLVIDSLQYVRTYHPDGSRTEELYNYRQDEWQRENLALLDEYDEILGELGRSLDVIAATCTEHGFLPNRLSASSLAGAHN